MKNPFNPKKLAPSFRTLSDRFENPTKIILRDYLAMERTTLANERTLFAYIRSSIYFTLAAIAFQELEQLTVLRRLSYPLFGLSVALIAWGVVRYRALQKKLKAYYDAMKQERETLKKDKEVEEAPWLGPRKSN